MTKRIVEDILNTKNITKIYEEYKYFPMDLLMNDDTDMHFVLGVRGDGKTHNAKKYILKDWFEKGIKSYWVVPHKNEVDEMIATKDFHMDILIDEILVDDDDWDPNDYQGYSKWDYINKHYSQDDIYCHGLASQVRMQKDFLYDTTKEDIEAQDWFLRFIPLSMYAKYKKGRHPRVLRMYFDEFMRETYLKNEAFKVLDLMTSVQREKKEFKMIFLGNAISLNHPLFVALNVFELEEQIINTYNDDKGKLFKIWKWKRPEEDAENKNGKLLWYRTGEITGYNDYAVKNNFKNDNVSNIVQFGEEDLTSGYIVRIHTFKIEDIYISAYKIDKQFNSQNKTLYWFRVEKDPSIISTVKYAISRESVEDGIDYVPDMAWEIAGHVMKDRIWYDSIVAKQYLYEVIKRHF